jgi:hypothetical protein
MWIARDSSEARLAAALPEPPGPDEATPDSAPEAPPVPPPAPAAVATPSPAEDRPGGVLAAARAAYVGAGFGPSFGGRLAAALALASPNLALHVSVLGAGTVAGSADVGYASGRVGGGIAWGAPWGTAPLGVSIEGGEAAFVDTTAQGPWTSASRSFLRPYGEFAVTGQWGGSRVVRPFATVSASYQAPVTLGGSPSATFASFTAALDLGVVWRSW